MTRPEAAVGSVVYYSPEVLNVRIGTVYVNRTQQTRSNRPEASTFPVGVGSASLTVFPGSSDFRWGLGGTPVSVWWQVREVEPA